MTSAIPGTNPAPESAKKSERPWSQVSLRLDKETTIAAVDAKVQEMEQSDETPELDFDLLLQMAKEAKSAGKTVQQLLYEVGPKRGRGGTGLSRTKLLVEILTSLFTGATTRYGTAYLKEWVSGDGKALLEEEEEDKGKTTKGATKGATKGTTTAKKR